MKKILLVDDSRSVRLICRRVMGNLGFQSVEAEDGSAALEVLKQNPDVSVILLDWNMPVMDGLTFLKTIRAEPHEPRPFVVMCTTENEASRIAQALQEGADEYVMKPFTEDIIREKLQEVGAL
jgi:two-component system, chemotaxis family, chemotaxis protein CheY